MYLFNLKHKYRNCQVKLLSFNQKIGDCVFNYKEKIKEQI